MMSWSSGYARRWQNQKQGPRPQRGGYWVGIDRPRVLQARGPSSSAQPLLRVGVVFVVIALVLVVVRVGRVAEFPVLVELDAVALVQVRVVRDEEPLGQLELQQGGVDLLEGGRGVQVPRHLVGGECDYALDRGLGDLLGFGVTLHLLPVVGLLVRVILYEQADPREVVDRVVAQLLDIPGDPTEDIDGGGIDAGRDVTTQPRDHLVRAHQAIVVQVLHVFHLLIDLGTGRLVEVGRPAPHGLDVRRRGPE
mmetsp:Transcript_12936/g.32260  ORF Transcript_12936/g.32260 Transcript_12936/m.32260 type:complete len:251 (-) Transcript_12936:581-1333(-)